MAKFSNLDLERKRQLVLNFRVASMMADYIAQKDNASPEEVLNAFRHFATKDVFNMPVSEIERDMQQIDSALEQHIKNESSGAIRIGIES